MRKNNLNVIYLNVYVGDIIITYTNKLEIDLLKTNLENKFKLKDLCTGLVIF